MTADWAKTTLPKTAPIKVGTPVAPSRVGASSEPRLVTRRQLQAMIPFTPQHILRLEKKGRFPRRIRLGANRVAWLLSEIEAWVAARMAERDVAER
jgi:prophage regulatory protein